MLKYLLKNVKIHIFAVPKFNRLKKMNTKNPAKVKKIIELIIVLLTAVASFIGGNVSAKNGYKLSNSIINEQTK